MERGKKEGAQILKGLLTGMLVAAVLIGALCFVGALLLSKELIPEGATRYMAWAVCAIGVFVGCQAAQRKAGCARLPVCIGCAGMLLLLMASVRALMGSTSETAWYTAAISVVCAVAAALLGAGKKKRYR